MSFTSSTPSWKMHFRLRAIRFFHVISGLPTSLRDTVANTFTLNSGLRDWCLGWCHLHSQCALAPFWRMSGQAMPLKISQEIFLGFFYRSLSIITSEIRSWKYSFSPKTLLQENFQKILEKLYQTISPKKFHFFSRNSTKGCHRSFFS